VADRVADAAEDVEALAVEAAEGVEPRPLARGLLLRDVIDDGLVTLPGGLVRQVALAELLDNGLLAHEERHMHGRDDHVAVAGGDANVQVVLAAERPGVDGLALEDVAVAGAALWRKRSAGSYSARRAAMCACCGPSARPVSRLTLCRP
jgi:hypothetical protein